MNRKLPKEGVIITVGLLLFVSISLILNLISGHLFDAADTALSESETSFGVEAEENTASLYEQGEQEAGEREAEAQNTPAYSICIPIDDPAVTSESTAEPFEAVSDGVVKSLTDNNIRHSVSEIYQSGAVQAQTINSIRDGDHFTDVIVSTPDGTLHYTVNRTQSGAAYEALITALFNCGIDLPSAAVLTVEEPASKEQSEPQTEAVQSEHDAPVIVR